MWSVRKKDFEYEKKEMKKYGLREMVRVKGV